MTEFPAEIYISEKPKAEEKEAHNRLVEELIKEDPFISRELFYRWLMKTSYSPKQTAKLCRSMQNRL